MNAARHSGFTLIELLIVMAIIAILVAIALPSYQNYVLQSHRTAAIDALQELASREATYYSANNIYTTSLITLGYSADPMPIPNGGNGQYYAMSVTSLNDDFTAQAAPNGTQVNDSCGTFQLNGLGQKTMIGGTNPANICWGF